MPKIILEICKGTDNTFSLFENLAVLNPTVSEKIKWLKENAINLELNSLPNLELFNVTYYLTADIAEEKYTFWKLKYG